MILLLLLVGVGGPFLSKTAVEPYQNSHLALMQTDTVDTRLARTLALGSTRRFVVKFDHPIHAFEKSLLTNSGLKIEGYLPNYAYLVSGDGVIVKDLLDKKTISWASAYERRWKLASSLVKTESDTLQVWLFDDADVYDVAKVLGDRFGTRIYSVHDGINKTLLIERQDERLEEIASCDAVRWIEPFCAPVFYNNRAQWVLQSWQEENRPLWDRGLDGKGVVVSTGDAGISTSHFMFRDSNVAITTWGNYPTHRKIIAYQPSAPDAVFGDMPSFSYHGTHTAGTVAGDDSYWGKNSPYDGMAPRAKLYFIDIGSSGGIAYPSDYNDMYELPWHGNEGGRAKFMSNSWGSGGAFRVYDIPSRQTDEFMWNHKDFLIFFSAGNSGNLGVSPPSTAKNVVSVGACLNGTSASAPLSISSMGPSADGRIKPTVVAPGVLISPNGAANDGYQELAGTSMSSPALAGACALVVQYLRQGCYPSGAPGSADSIEPSAALLKAMLISSTISDFANPIPDSQIGWGRVCLDSLLYFAGEENLLWVHDDTFGIETGDEVSYTVDVTGSSWPLRVTLVWTDYPGDPAAAKQIVNDLDLEAESPSGAIYRGNVFASNFSKTGGSKDLTNVEECLRIKNPEIGTWRIRVKGANVPEAPQAYALVVTAMMNLAYELTESGVRIDDSGDQNPNAALDPGETAILYPRVLNSGEGEAKSVEMTLSTDDPMLTILNETSTYGSIKPGQVAEGQGFEVELSAAAQPDQVITLKGLAKTAGSNPDTLFFHITVGESAVMEKKTSLPPLISCPSVTRGSQDVLLNLFEKQEVRLELFDVVGRRVEVMVDGELEAGSYSFRVKGVGVYFLFLTAGDYRKGIKIIRVGT